uniref:RRM domain-containing protein n=1 Tax=Heterorhabditis bacteriophora TaxID=37862 RepID=A0A1I7XP51_HETBA
MHNMYCLLTYYSSQSIIHNFAVIRMIPGGLSENRLSGLMRAFGLDVVFTDDLVNVHHIFFKNPNDNMTETIQVRTNNVSVASVSTTPCLHEIEKTNSINKENMSQSIEDLSHPLLTLMDMIEARLAERQCSNSQINPPSPKTTNRYSGIVVFAYQL